MGALLGLPSELSPLCFAGVRDGGSPPAACRPRGGARWPNYRNNYGHTCTAAAWAPTSRVTSRPGGLCTAVMRGGCGVNGASRLISRDPSVLNAAARSGLQDEGGPPRDGGRSCGHGLQRGLASSSASRLGAVRWGEVKLGAGGRGWVDQAHPCPWSDAAV